MKIIEINIQYFGKLKDFTVRPTDGVNIIYGENESGKSTVMAFVKAIFYGLGSGEKRRQYEPWDGGQPGGSILFENEGKTFLLSRTFGSTKAGDKISLFNQSLGESVSIPAGQEPGAFILGINIKTFVNTVFIGQAGTTVEGENHEIIAKLTNLTSAGDEHISKGEVEKRLKNGAAAIDSKKNTAILPELRKQKHELLEARMEMQTALKEADELRDQIASAYRHRNTLTKERKFLSDTAERLAMQDELKEIDRITEQRGKLLELEAKYGELDAWFHDNSAEGMDEFLDKSKQLLEEEKNHEILMEEKKKQLDELKKESDNFDSSKLSMITYIKKYAKEIASAFERYDSLINEKNEIEIALENQDNEKPESKDNLIAIAICAVIVVALVILGLAFHWIFYVICIVAVICMLAYWLVYRKNVEMDDISDDRIGLDNVNEDLRALNSEMRPILENFQVKSMEQFDREYKEIERVQKQYLAFKKRKKELQKEIDTLDDELEDTRDKLRENLAVYHETDSNEEAHALISRLSQMKQDYEKQAVELSAARDTYNFMLKERDFDTLEERGRQLRGDINLEVPESFTEEKVNNKLAENEKKLEAINAQIIQQETELSLKPYSPQELDAKTDEIKAITKRIEHYEFELAAIEEAQSALTEAFQEMQLDFGPMINYRAGRVLSGFTDEKYSSVFVSEKLVPSVAESGSSQPRSCDVLSAGTYDQIYLSLRLALSGVMADEKLPVLLDDSFAQFDDKRMRDALSFIKEDNALGEMGQIIIFTCHRRMLRAAQKLDMTDSVFSMDD